MSWFIPEEGLSEKARESLVCMAASGSSEESGVAEILNTIAGNSAEQCSDEHLLACAHEISASALSFIKEVGGKDEKDLAAAVELIDKLHRALLNASEVVDKGEGEDYAYQREIEAATWFLGEGTSTDAKPKKP